MKQLFILSLVALSLFACKKDRLELDPLSQVDREDFYTNDQELDQATVAIYDGLQQLPLREFALTEMRSDNARSSSGEGDWGQFESFTVVATNLAVRNYWSANYNVIFRTNRVLENLGVIRQANLKIQLEGEAKFNRALAHFNLVRAYGDVPIIDKEIGIAESDYFNRDPASEVYDFIVQDLEDALLLLPNKGAITPGRATIAAAQALLAKVLLHTKNYTRAQTLLEDVIANPNYSLESNYRDIFFNEGNDELLFYIPYKNDDLFESQDFSFEMTAGGVRSGLNYLTTNFISNMSSADSIRKPILQNQLAPQETAKFLTTSLNARLCGNDWIVLRLADVYLMHVEAVMAGFPSTQNLAAINSFNKVRERAGLSKIPVDGNGEISLNLLLNERRYELAFENQRFYDLVRTEKARSVLENHALSEGFIFNSTDLLLPIPQAEINVSKGLLKQNPGY